MGVMSTYLRVVLTTRCNYRCGFCHMEGDPHAPGAAPELPLERLLPLLRCATLAGARKIKFLGGEPFLRGDLPEIVRAIRGWCPESDLSIITAGAVPVGRLRDAYAAGLDRVNVSFHGFGREAFAENNRARGAFELREAFVAAAEAEAAARRVPMKVNYVYSGAWQRDDLAALLSWAAGRAVVVGLLDDLGGQLSWRDLLAVVTRLRGAPSAIETTPDAHSLATRLLTWDDGLQVELKHQRLGEVAPHDACETCAVREGCKEGIVALRLTHAGLFRPCMDRSDLALDLGPVIGGGDLPAAMMLRAWMEAV
jgi:cyclic pyranopterin phosphate synthase